MCYGQQRVKTNNLRTMLRNLYKFNFFFFCFQASEREDKYEAGISELQACLKNVSSSSVHNSWLYFIFFLITAESFIIEICCLMMKEHLLFEALLFL